MAKLIWYIARADLSRPGDAPPLHSRADVQWLNRLGWNALLMAGATDMSVLPGKAKEIVIQDMSAPFERMKYELKVIYRLLVARQKPDFVFFRGPTNLLWLGIALYIMRLPFGQEINGVSRYLYEPHFSARNLFEKVCDLFFGRKSALIVAVTEQLEKQWARKRGPNTLLVTARNGVAYEDIQPCVPISSGFDVKFGFLGKAYKGRGLEQAILMISELKKRGINAGLSAVGGGPEVPKLKKLAEELAVDNAIEFREAVIPSKMNETIADCDLMWASYEDEPSIALSGLSPLKLWTYLALAKPVLVRDPGVLEHYHSVPGFLWTTAQTSAELADDVQRYLNEFSLEDLRDLGQTGRRYVEANVSWKAHVEIISNAIQDVLKKRRFSLSHD